MGPISGIIEQTGQAVLLQSTQAQTITMPFDFEPYTLATPTTPQLLPDFGSVEFINDVGSSALTIFAMLDALAFLGALVMIYIAVRALWWLYKFVTEEPTDGIVLDVSGGLKTAEEITGDEENIYSTAGRVLNFAKKNKNPFKF